MRLMSIRSDLQDVGRWIKCLLSECEDLVLILKVYVKLQVVSHGGDCNPSTQEAETGEPWSNLAS